MDTARKWFYHIEAVMRHPKKAPTKSEPMSAQITPASLNLVAAQAHDIPPPMPDTPATATAPKSASDTAPKPAQAPEGDVLNAPIVPYI
jgi:hypothetical protein